LLSPNAVFLALVLACLLAHLGVLAWWRNGMALLLLNAVVALAVLAYQAPRLSLTLSPPMDGQMLGLIGFEVAVLLVSIVGARRLAWLGFALHLCVSLAALAFVLTFQMDRLI